MVENDDQWLPGHALQYPVVHMPLVCAVYRLWPVGKDLAKDSAGDPFEDLAKNLASIRQVLGFGSSQILVEFVGPCELHSSLSWYSWKGASSTPVTEPHSRY